MAQKTKRVTVAGDEYEITQLGALEGRRIWLALLRVLAEPIKSLAEADKLSEKGVFGALAVLAENLDNDTSELLCKAFAKRTRLHVQDGDRWPELDDTLFDQHFAGRYFAMSQWLGECVLFNFANFSEGASLERLLASARAAVASKSVSPKDSTGTSIES